MCQEFYFQIYRCARVTYLVCAAVQCACAIMRVLTGYRYDAAEAVAAATTVNKKFQRKWFSFPVRHGDAAAAAANQLWG